MRGVVFKGDRKLEILNFDDPEPGPTDAIIEMKASSFCGSDLKFYRDGVGPAVRTLGLPTGGMKDGDPIIAGHEPCGVVAALGKDVDPRSFKVGDRVVVFHYDGCNYCDHCRKGWTQMCDHGAKLYGITAHGGHANYLKVPAKTLIHLPEEVSFAAGAAIACGTGTAYHALVRIDLSARDTLAVFGLGPVGQSAVQFASAMGARVIAIDVSKERAEKAREFGATDVVDASAGDPVQVIRDMTGGKGVTCAMDCSGVAPARQAAVRSTDAWGRIAFVGAGGDVSLDVTKDVIGKQRTIIGSWTFSDVGLANCVRFVADRGVDVDKQFTDRWTLDQADQAYREFDKQSRGKGVILF